MPTKIEIVLIHCNKRLLCKCCLTVEIALNSCTLHHIDLFTIRQVFVGFLCNMGYVEHLIRRNEHFLFMISQTRIFLKVSTRAGFNIKASLLTKMKQICFQRTGCKGTKSENLVDLASKSSVGSPVSNVAGLAVIVKDLYRRSEPKVYSMVRKRLSIHSSIS